MRTLVALLSLSLLLVAPAAAAQEEITIDLVLEAPASRRTCYVDVADVEPAPVASVHAPAREIGLPGAEVPVPGYLLVVGDDRVLDAPAQTITLEASWVRVGGATLRAEPAEQHDLTVEGVLVCVITAE